MMAEKNDAFFRELVEHHISGQLKVAPEHMSDNALYYMGKPSFKVYEQFRERYAASTKSWAVNSILCLSDELASGCNA